MAKAKKTTDSASAEKKTPAKTPRSKKPETAAKKTGEAAKPAGKGKSATAKKSAPKTADKTPAAKKAPAAKKKPAKATARKAATKPSAAQPPAPEVLSPIQEVLNSKTEELRRLEEDDRELPLEYGDTKIVLMPRDPEWVFTYWELSPDTRRKNGLIRNQHNRHLVLRVYEESAGGPVSYDIPVNDYTSSWYIRIREKSDTIRVKLGFYDDGGDFRQLTESEPLQISRLGLSEQDDVEFAEISDEVYDQIVRLSGGVKISQRLGSDEFLRSLQQRLYDNLHEGPFSSAGLSGGAPQMPSSFILGGSSGYFSGSLLSSSSLFAAGAGGEAQIKRPRQGEQDFWLEAGVDVIVYGATEPDAKVTFMGNEIALTPDGTFRVRMVLPDSKLEFPIVAQSANGKHTRKVTPVVTRSTEGDPRKPA